MAKKCTVCGVRNQYTGSKGVETAPHLSEMCNYCFEEGGWENTHSDYGHDASSEETTELAGEDEKGKRVEGCWICFPELNLAKTKPAKGHSGPRQQKNERRPQLNHKGHNHPQTPAARRACKAAFWASLTPVKNISTPQQLQAAMQQWNHSCDGNGKPTEAKKETTWNVAPRGPKGGVINQLKAAMKEDK